MRKRPAEPRSPVGRVTPAGRRAPGRALVVTLALAAFLPSCGDSPTGPVIPPPRPGITFRASTFPLPAGSLALQVRTSTAEEITLALVATEVEDLYGWGVDLVFDVDILSLVSFEQGDFLEADGVDVVSEVADDSAGRLVIGQARVGDVDGVDGGGDLLLLTFRAGTEGSTGIQPESGAGFDSAGDPLDVQFLGGTITVVQ